MGKKNTQVNAGHKSCASHGSWRPLSRRTVNQAAVDHPWRAASLCALGVYSKLI